MQGAAKFAERDPPPEMAMPKKMPSPLRSKGTGRVVARDVGRMTGPLGFDARSDWSGTLALRNMFDRDNVWPSVVNSRGGIDDIPRQVSIGVEYRGPW